MNWYVVHTAVRSEGLVDSGLKRLGCETLFIRQRRKVRRLNKTEIRLAPYFPRYVFAAIPDGVSMYSVNTLHGVSTVLYNGSGPFTLSSEAIEQVKSQCDQAGVFWDDAVSVDDAYDTTQGHLGRRYRAGERVRVTFGLLLHQIGVVIEDFGASVSVLFGELKVLLSPRCLEPESA